MKAVLAATSLSAYYRMFRPGNASIVHLVVFGANVIRAKFALEIRFLAPMCRDWSLRIVSRRDDFRMGVSVHYSAVPPSSTLFSRLQGEKAFVLLMKRFFGCGNGIYSFFDEPERIRTMIVDAQAVEDAVSRIPPELREATRRQFVEEARFFRQHQGEISALMSQEIEHELKDLTDGHGDVFGSEHEARRWMNEFRLELGRTRSTYPGIDARVHLRRPTI